MRYIKPIFVTAGLLVVLTGCSSPKDASKDNFKNVLNGYYDRNCIMVAPRKTEFPVTVELQASNSEIAKKLNDGNTNQYEALVKVGLLEVKDGSAQVNDFDNFMPGVHKKTVPTKTYSLSPKGKEIFTKNTGKGILNSTEQGFCAANYQVGEISNFSEPSQSMGYTISNVNYTVSPKNVKEWAKNEAVVQAYPRLTKQLEENKNESAALVLMNDGWVHEREMKK
jgi:hypothetical protein